MKKLFAMSISIILATSMLAGCNLYANDDAPKEDTGSAAGTGDASGEVPALASTYEEFKTPRGETITWFEQGWTGLDKSKDFVTPEIKKRTNFEFGYDSMTVPTDNDYKQKLNLMVSAGDVPRIFFGANDQFTRDIYRQLGESNKLWDFSEIIKDYPNLYDLVEPELKMYATKDHKNYFVPTQTGRGYDVIGEPGHGIFVNQQMLDQLGLPQPDSPEALYEFLKRAKNEITIDGQPAYGMVQGENLAGVEQIFYMFTPFTEASRIPSTYYMPYDVKNNFEVKNFMYTDSPEMMEAAKFLNKLAYEGLLDKEILTIKTAQFEEKATSGRAAVINTTWWDINKFVDVMKDDNPDVNYTRPKDIFANETVREYRSTKWTNWIGAYSSLIISKEVPEETVRHMLAVMDYMATKEGQLLVQAGIEGKSYEFDANGKYITTEEFKKETNDMDWNMAAAYGVGYYAQLVFNIPAIEDIREQSPTLSRKDNYDNWKDSMQWKRDAYEKDMEPTLDYYFIPGEVEGAKMPAIIEAEREFRAKVIAAKPEEVEGIVKEWAQTCKRLGIDEIIQEHTALMDELKQTMK